METLNPTRKELLTMFALDADIVKAQGFHLFDNNGEKYLDFFSQYGAMPFGHNPKELWEALADARQNDTPSLLQPLRSGEAKLLADLLANVTPGDLGITTFTNSGAETVEAGIKLARIKTGRNGILSAYNSFHGKTLGALSATGQPYYQDGFSAPAPGFEYVPYGNLEALSGYLENNAKRTAAFIFEPIQGEGGIVCPPQGYIDEVIRICRSFEVLTILDEIQTGLGRTGELFACSSGKEVPDILLLSKALGGGMVPIGACVASRTAWDDRFGLRHSSTFANNGLVCRVARATVETLCAENQKLVRNVRANGEHLRDKLEDLKVRFPRVIKEVRGRGFMLGLQFHNYSEQSISAALAFSSLNGGLIPLISSYLFNKHKILTAPLFNENHVLRIQPALTVGRPEIAHILAALEDVCQVLDTYDVANLVRHIVKQDFTSSEISLFSGELPKDCEAPDNRFGFIVHYTEPEDVVRSDPSLQNLTPDELGRWLAWAKKLGAGVVRKIPTITSKIGASADGLIISVPMLPSEMLGSNRKASVSMIRSAVDIAANNGATRVGLGAFTSVSTRGGELATGRGVPITSGNTLTAVVAVQAIERVARRSNLDLENATIAIIGAAGSIGRLGTLLLSRKARRLLLVGNPANPFSSRLIARVADEVYETFLGFDQNTSITSSAAALDTRRIAEELSLTENHVGLGRKIAERSREIGQPAPVEGEIPLDEAIAEADIILVATSADTILIDPCNLTPGTLVCDIARPPNVARCRIPGQRSLVFDGGLVRPPFDFDLGPFQTLPKNLCWGCLGETMLLALANKTQDFSIGPKLSLEGADEIAKLAKIHGFYPSPPFWYGEEISGASFEEFANHVFARRNGRDARGELTILPKIKGAQTSASMRSEN